MVPPKTITLDDDDNDDDDAEAEAEADDDAGNDCDTVYSIIYVTIAS